MSLELIPIVLGAAGLVIAILIYTIELILLRNIVESQK